MLADFQKQRIALFGTSADPPTTGHKTILQWLAKRYDLVAVWAADNPFKAKQTSLEHRAGMLAVLIDSLTTAQQNITLSQDLSDRRTIETVKKARKLWGTSTEFTLVMGSDLLKQISKWYCIDHLLKEVQLLIVPRPGYPIEKVHLEELASLGGRWEIAEFQTPSVSSTAYRQGKKREAIAQPVEDYILRKQLYACQDR
ncbi:MAG: nicotinate-nucleotide adenylyltransferase [Okeania sp. SIO2D1]|nr:nicotinate-nucleotide adenylyltransferase [Okeania sp. SIO2D1]